MSVYYKGNTISVIIKPGESNIVTLENGYSFEKYISHTSIMLMVLLFHTCSHMMCLFFPPVNSKSPCILNLSIVDTTATAELRFVIEKFGQIPDAHYFDKSFTPILVSGDDGNKYNVILSNQI